MSVFYSLRFLETSASFPLNHKFSGCYIHSIFKLVITVLSKHSYILISCDLGWCPCLSVLSVEQQQC